MKIQINFGDVETSDAISTHVDEQIEKAVAHFRDQVTRVEVHLRDDNSQHKAGRDDKRVTMELRFAGLDPIAIEDTGSDLYDTITTAAHKLNRAATRIVDRRKTH